MLPSFARPLAHHGVAAFILFKGIRCPAKWRNALLVPMILLLIFSLREAHHVDVFPGLGFHFGMLQVVTILCSPIVLNSRVEKKRLRKATKNCNMWSDYRVYNNPRMLSCSTREPIRTGERAPLWGILIQSLPRILIPLGLELATTILAALILGSCEASDFSAEKATILRRLWGGSVSLHELAVRFLVSVSWIGLSISRLTLFHTLLSIIFVAGLGFDTLEDWPPLFGSVLESYTIQRFWGKTWHRLLSASAVLWARACIDFIVKTEACPRLRNFLVAFMVFTISGLAHAVVAKSLGETSTILDIWFFWVNSLAVTLEVLVLEVGKVALSTLTRGTRFERNGWKTYLGLLVKPMGFMWVVLFFLWSVPRLMYPKIHSELNQPAR